MTHAPQPVLHLTTSGQTGGVERCLLSLIAGMDRGRYAPAVIMGSPGPLCELLAQADTPATVVALPDALRRLSRIHRNRGVAARIAPLWHAPGYLRRLRQAGNRAQPRLIHSHGPKMLVFSALLQRRWGVPLVWHLHDFPAQRADGSEPPLNRGLNWLSARVAVAIANSQAVAAAYAKRVPRLAPKLSVVPNGVPLAAFAAGDRARFRHQHGIAPDAFVFGMVAIFAPWKGQEVFLEAARRVRERLPQARFLLAGDDIYDTAGHGRRRGELEAQARALGLAEAVTFTGYLGLQAELASAYAGLDVLIHASTRPEPFGRTLIEAMAAGIPVIAARDGGVPEIIPSDAYGVLTPPGDAGALAEAMLGLHANAGRRRALAENGRRRVGEQFSEAAISAAVSRIYDQTLGGVG